MSVAVCAAQSQNFRPDFSEDFGKIIIGLAGGIAEKDEKKRRVFSQAESLRAALYLASKNPIFVEDKAIALVQSILDGIEKHLDGETNPVDLNGEERDDLQKLYQDMCQYVCEIMIRQADAASRS